MKKSWSTYYENTKALPPSPTLLSALEECNPTVGVALDLGCGAGRDTRYLLEQGFHVQAVDKDPEAERYIKQLPYQDRLEFICARFEAVTYGQYDVINAHYSLPFSGTTHVDTVMDQITQSLTPGGLFVGQLFGINDEWNTPDSQLAFHDLREVEQFFSGFKDLQIKEVNEVGELANGATKHWHVFNIIACK